MDYWFAKFVLTLAVIGDVLGLPFGCSYNGTAYGEGDTIITEEPCLSCVCRKGSLVCNLKVCADSPETLPPGCFVVHKANDCCPQLFCDEGYRQNGVELRTGYSVEQKLVENGCVINGSVYAEGSAVASSQLCEYCYCIQGQMKCIKPKCFKPFEGCKAIYKDSSCCPSYYDCRDLAVSISTPRNKDGCKIDGIYYPDGEMVASPNGTNCESCYCMKGKIECAPIVCSMDFFKDCQPLSSPNQCCPTSFACDKPISNVTNDSIRHVTEKSELIDDFNRSAQSSESSTLFDEKTTENANETPTTEETTTGFSTITTESEITTYTFPWKGEEIEENSTVSGSAITSIINYVSNNEKLLSLSKNKTDSTNFYSNFGLNISLQATDFQIILNETTNTFIDEATPEHKTTTLMTLTSTEAAEKEKNTLDTENDSKLDFADQRGVKESQIGFDDFSSNLTLESDDYDSYDYSEPKLPPSLPNLVIFPFVAADAVVKEKEESFPKPETYDSFSVKRIDMPGAFYKDFFSPPAQTEGGFVPKESPDPFYKNSYFDKNEKFPSHLEDDSRILPHITVSSKPKNDICFSHGRQFQHGEVLSEAGDCVSCVCVHGAIVCEDVVCPEIESGCTRTPEQDFSCCGKVVCDSDTQEVLNSQVTKIELLEPASNTTPDPFSDVIRTESAPDLSFMSEITPAFISQTATKPVTVTYKNVVVDYYPDYQITSTRNILKMKSNETSVKEDPFHGPSADKPEKYFPTVVTPIQDFRDPEKNNGTDNVFSEQLLQETLTQKPLVTFPAKKPTTISTTTETSFFDELLKSILSEDVKHTSSTKYKYSSKIKASTVKPKVEDVTLSEKLVGNVDNSSSSSYSLLEMLFDPEPSLIVNQTAQKHKIYDLAVKPVKKEENKKPNKISLESSTVGSVESEMKDSQISTPESKDEHKINSEKPEKVAHNPLKKNEEVKQTKPSLGSLLKLAGCNIYGRMYRVGKIIVELSGPCLECVCTDLGVQCKPLLC